MAAYFSGRGGAVLGCWLLVVGEARCIELFQQPGTNNQEPALPPTQRVHDLHVVSFLQRLRGMLAARDDFPIELDCDAAFGEAFVAQQGGEGACAVDLPRLAVELYIHAHSLP